MKIPGYHGGTGCNPGRDQAILQFPFLVVMMLGDTTSNIFFKQCFLVKTNALG